MPFLMQVGDKVKLNKTAVDVLGKPLFVALSDEVFTVVDIRTDHSCSDMNPDCCCDKYMLLKSGVVSLTDIVQAEISIHDLKKT